MMQVEGKTTLPAMVDFLTGGQNAFQIAELPPNDEFLKHLAFSWIRM